MKKISLVVLIMLFVSSAAFSQFKLGVKGGVNISSVHFNKEIVNSDNVTGFHVGPMFEFMIPMVGLGVDAAILYSQRGMTSGERTFKNDYIDVPINLKWKIGIPLIKFYAAAGPYFGFKVGGKKFWEIPGDIGTQMRRKSFSSGLNFTAGIELLQHLQVGLTYGLGLTDNYSIERPNLKSNTGKDRGWVVSAAILF